VLRLPAPIVSVDWLHAHLADPSLRIVDVRWSLIGPPGREQYADGHVPGATFVDADRELSARGEGPGRHPIPAPDRLAALLGAHGIGDGTPVVAYDDAGGSIAARVWWLFRHFGHDGDVAVLDGGLAAWTAAGGPLTKEPTRREPATWTPRGPRADVADATAVSDRSPETLVIDARAPERYRGEHEPIDPAAGHIPGALSAPWAENLGPDGRFLPPADLRRRFAAMGARDGAVIAYCGSGLSATHDLLALELAGIRGATLYEGSWSDWASDPARPVATGATP
jgi:thiosulfate/3-mercaptopyruvate sulfurtransferase